MVDLRGILRHWNRISSHRVRVIAGFYYALLVANSAGILIALRVLSGGDPIRWKALFIELTISCDIGLLISGLGLRGVLAANADLVLRCHPRILWETFRWRRSSIRFVRARKRSRERLDRMRFRLDELRRRAASVDSRIVAMRSIKGQLEDMLESGYLDEQSRIEVRDRLGPLAKGISDLTEELLDCNRLILEIDSDLERFQAKFIEIERERTVIRQNHEKRLAEIWNRARLKAIADLREDDTSRALDGLVEKDSHLSRAWNRKDVGLARRARRDRIRASRESRSSSQLRNHQS